MKRNVVVGTSMVGIGLLLLLQNTLKLDVNIWDLLWPMFLLIPGIIIHINHFNGKPDSGSIFLAGILVVYGGFFLLKAITGAEALENASFVFTLGIGVGLLESYIFNGKSNKDLFLTLFFMFISFYRFLKTYFVQFKGMNNYVFPLALVVYGAYLLVSSIKKEA